MVSETDEVVCLRAPSDAACVPLWHARETQVTEVDDASNATRCRFWNRVKKVNAKKLSGIFSTVARLGFVSIITHT
tara:strand:- start:363 stop:590 length:228 start_codon:yes stop_codon:yes gene_type:complete